MTSAVYGDGPARIVKRLSLTMAWCGDPATLQEIFSGRKTRLSRFINERPELIGILVWPYQCASWSPSTRLQRLKIHCELVDKLGPPFDLGVNQQFVFADLSFVRPGLRLVLDQPIWFLREGSLVLNLFVDRTRIYSLAFSFCTVEGELSATIGAIQGRNLEEAAEEYKLLTKLAHGMRPRDLLIETFRLICSNVSITRIFAVSNEDRHHLHPFFGTKPSKHAANYNEIWEDRGGMRIDRSFYEIPAEERRRNLADIPQKKRSMYRKRYELLDEIQNSLCDSLKNNPTYASCGEFDL